jgi:hypothetical protein
MRLNMAAAYAPAILANATVTERPRPRHPARGRFAISVTVHSIDGRRGRLDQLSALSPKSEILR